MLIVTELSSLRPELTYWVPAMRAQAPGRTARRFLVDAETCRPATRNFPAFDSRAECLRWIMAHRADVEAGAPHARVAAVRLDAWMLGMDAV